MFLFIMLYKVVLNTVSVNKKTLSVTIQMKATGQYFPVVLFLTLYEGVLIAIQTKSTEQYFPVVLFIICLLYTSPSPRDGLLSRMPSSA